MANERKVSTEIIESTQVSTELLNEVALGWEETVEVLNQSEYESTENKNSNSNRASDISEYVLNALRCTLASVNGASPQTASKIIERVQASTNVLSKLPSKTRKTYKGVFEVLIFECTVSESRGVDLTYLPVSKVYSKDVRDELSKIKEVKAEQVPTDPHAFWFSLVESIQRQRTRSAAMTLAEKIKVGAPLVELLPAFKAVEPPTTQKKSIRTGKVRSAFEFASELRAERAGKPNFRFSSGLPTLDLGYTGVDEPEGFITPGQFSVVMGPTGTGKSSFSYSVTPAFGLDLLNWGLSEAYQVFFHTEEESIDKLKGFRMDMGQKYHHLAKNLVIDAIGTSRTRMAETLYDLVISADEKSRKSRKPITEYLPYIVQLDYLQSIQESGEDEKEATAKTAEFLLRGVAAWNPEEMAKFSGVDFRSYAGMSWPIGMDNHRVAVLAYAQLVKVSDETLYYKPNKRGTQLSDFVLLDDKDNPKWDLKEGDLRLFGKNQMRGSGVVANNAHSIVILHRSVPYNNPSVKNKTGGISLSDTRARVLFEKSRTGSRISYAPMRFDVQSNGFRAQYFDEIAERAVAEGKLTNVHESYIEKGDPMLPNRPRRSKLASTRY
ncbi:MAG: hypothetical protein ACKOW9_06155 [Candidatus Paceibacterota bacterium]